MIKKAGIGSGRVGVTVSLAHSVMKQEEHKFEAVITRPCLHAWWYTSGISTPGRQRLEAAPSSPASQPNYQRDPGSKRHCLKKQR